MPRKGENLGVVHGRWGEDVACAYLQQAGYDIVARNVRPCTWDRRLEIDIVARCRANNVVVFVEVKQSARPSPYARRLRRVDRRKRELLAVACRSWLRSQRWGGGYRFDVIEVYGVPGNRPVVDHIERVRLFAVGERFVNWAE